MLQASVLALLPGDTSLAPVLWFPWLVHPPFHGLFSRILQALFIPLHPQLLRSHLGQAAATEMGTVGVLDRPLGRLD